MDRIPDRDLVPDMDGVLDSRWDITLWMGCQIVDEVPDQGGVLHRVPIWFLLSSDSTGWHEALMSYQSEIPHSLIFFIN